MISAWWLALLPISFVGGFFYGVFGAVSFVKEAKSFVSELLDFLFPSKHNEDTDDFIDVEAHEVKHELHR